MGVFSGPAVLAVDVDRVVIFEGYFITPQNFSKEVRSLHSFIPHPFAERHYAFVVSRIELSMGRCVERSRISFLPDALDATTG